MVLTLPTSTIAHLLHRDRRNTSTSSQDQDPPPSAPADAANSAETAPDSATGSSAGQALPDIVNAPTCTAFAAEIKAMKCSLTTQVSGSPDGCECQMGSSEDDCPPYRASELFKDYFTTIKADQPMLGVRLCLYTRPERSAPEVTEADLAVRRAKIKAGAQELVDHAVAMAKADAAAVETGWLKDGAGVLDMGGGVTR